MAANEEVFRYVIEGSDRGSAKVVEGNKRVSKSFDEVDQNLKEVGRDSQTLEEKIAAFTEHRRRLAERLQTDDDANLKREFSRTNQRIGFLEKIRKALQTEAAQIEDTAAKDLVDFGGEGARPGNLLIGGLVAAAALAAPAIGAAIEGALASGVVAVGLAGGVLSAIKDERVRSAARSFGADISTQFFSGGSAFVGPIIKSLDILKSAFSDLNLGEVFAQAAPGLESLAKGIGDLAKNALPGFNKLMAKAPEILAEVGDGLASTGLALSDFFTELADSKGTITGIRSLFGALNGTIRILGVTLSWLSDRWLELAIGIGKVAGVFEDIPPWLKWIPGLALLGSNAGYTNDQMEKLTNTGDGLTNHLAAKKGTLAEVAQKMRDLAQATEDAESVFKDFFNINMDVDQANLAVQRDMIEFQKQLKDTHYNFDGSTEAGNRNREMLSRMVQDLERQREAAIKAAGGNQQAIDQINQDYDKAIDKLGTMVGKTKNAKDAFKDLAGEYKIKVFFEVFGQEIISGAGKVISTVINKIFGGGRASGGPVMAGVPYRINERGSETVTFPAGGTVHPANLSPVGGPMELRVVGGQSSFERFMAQFIKQYVRLYGGGNVQKAFGGS